MQTFIRNFIFLPLDIFLTGIVIILVALLLLIAVPLVVVMEKTEKSEFEPKKYNWTFLALFS